jgi:glutamate synthase (NADPH/NADH) large chain
MPDAFMRRAAKECFGVELGDLFAVGMVFVSTDSAAETQATQAIEEVLIARNRSQRRELSVLVISPRHLL